MKMKNAKVGVWVRPKTFKAIANFEKIEDDGLPKGWDRSMKKYRNKLGQIERIASGGVPIVVRFEFNNDFAFFYPEHLRKE